MENEIKYEIILLSLAKSIITLSVFFYFPRRFSIVHMQNVGPVRGSIKKTSLSVVISGMLRTGAVVESKILPPVLSFLKTNSAVVGKLKAGATICRKLSSPLLLFSLLINSKFLENRRGCRRKA